MVRILLFIQSNQLILIYLQCKIGRELMGGITSAVASISSTLGCSITSIFVVGGVIIAIVTAVGTIIYIRKRLNKKDEDRVVIEAASSQAVNFNRIIQNIEYNNLGGLSSQADTSNLSAHNTQALKQLQKRLNTLEWVPVEMSEEKFNDLMVLTSQRFDEKMKQFVCPYTLEVMRYPCKMKCCQHLQRKNKWAEKLMLQIEILKHKRCLICQSPATNKSIIIDQDLYENILGFRQRLVKTFKNLSTEEEKKKWKSIIDKNFGKEYTNKHIERFKFSKSP